MAPIRVSFEFFPPKTDEMEKSLWEAVGRLAPLSPNFVSVTYGAGGSTRERTHSTVKRIVNETALTPAAHLTCVAATKDEINGVIQAYRDAGVRHIVALRGDPPAGGLGHVAQLGHPLADIVGGGELLGLGPVRDRRDAVWLPPARHATARRRRDRPARRHPARGPRLVLGPRHPPVISTLRFSSALG